MKILLAAALLIGASPPLHAQPAATLGHLKARQLKERQELRTDQKRRADLLKRTMAEDQGLFNRRQKQRQKEFEAARKDEKSALSASLRGLPQDERRRRGVEFKAKSKREQADFRRDAAQERGRFCHDLRTKKDYLKEVQVQETRQLEDKQRSELANFQP